MRIYKSTVLAAALLLGSFSMTVSAEEQTESVIEVEEGAQKAVFTFVNETGEKITKLYFYENSDETDEEEADDSSAQKKLAKDKKQNLAGTSGLKNGESIQLTYEAGENEDTSHNMLTFTVKFKTKSGYVGTYDNVYFETEKITLLAEDSVSGATPVEFATMGKEVELED